MKRTAIISIMGRITVQALSGCNSATRGAVKKVESTTPMVNGA